LDSKDEDEIGLAYMDAEINSDIDEELVKAINNRVEASENRGIGRKCVINNLHEIPEGMSPAPASCSLISSLCQLRSSAFTVAASIPGVQVAASILGVHSCMALSLSTATRLSMLLY